MNKKGNSEIWEAKKKLNALIKESQKKAKLSFCIHCGKSVTSFCTSHSIPKFCLNNISSGERLSTINEFVGIEVLDTEEGAKSAGTFKLICSECDNSLFRIYENPYAYEKEPTDQMLAQIAMKNYLHMISKRLEEIQRNEIEQEMFTPDPVKYSSIREVQFLDLHDYFAGYERARRGSIKDRGDWYYLCTFHRLDYCIPIAFQAAITPIFGFDGDLINNIFDMDPGSITSDIHFVGFPLGDYSVVFSFIDSRGHARYKKFYKTLRSLPVDDQLATINFLVFAYTENVFVSKFIDRRISQHRKFKEVCSTGAINTRGFSDFLLIKAMFEYDLSQRLLIPNLLSREYSLTQTNQEL